jgi:hypothetical protein
MYRYLKTICLPLGFSMPIQPTSIALFDHAPLPVVRRFDLRGCDRFDFNSVKCSI